MGNSPIRSRSVTSALLSVGMLGAIFAGNFTPKPDRQYYHPKLSPGRRYGGPAVIGPNPKRREKRAWMRANNASGRQWVKHRKAEQRAARARAAA